MIRISIITSWSLSSTHADSATGLAPPHSQSGNRKPAVLGYIEIMIKKSVASLQDCSNNGESDAAEDASTNSMFGLVFVWNLCRRETRDKR